MLLHDPLGMPLTVDKPAALPLAQLDLGIQGLAGLGVELAELPSTGLQSRDPVVGDSSLGHQRAQPSPAGRVGLRIHRRARVQELKGLVHAGPQRARWHDPGLASYLLGHRAMAPTRNGTQR
jgi:hypothetical protein